MTLIAGATCAVVGEFVQLFETSQALLKVAELASDVTFSPVPANGSWIPSRVRDRAMVYA